MLILGSPRVHHRQTGSTNADAREQALAGAPHGTLVTASQQLAGRGRAERRWHAPAGSALLCSLILRDPPPLVSIAAGVAVAEVVGAAAELKWPNDVLLAGRKVSGILVEARPRDHWAVVGIGINVAVDVDDLPAELSESAATLGLDRDAIEPTLTRLLIALESWLAADQPALLNAWRSRDALLGREVSWRDGRGVAHGIDERGRLLVDGEGRRHALDAGEVHLGSRETGLPGGAAL
jgi:BirA family biotin operon repressor/biotin-[acetyl-CoA-carboxylase] ligase